MQKPQLSLVLACYNEGPTLPQSLDKIKEVLKILRLSWEIVCIDDASSDDTVKHIKKFAKGKRNVHTYFHKENVGRGGTVKEGIYLSKGKIVGYIDVDLEVSPVYIIDFIREIEKGSDFVMAQRIYKENIKSLIRWLMSKSYLYIVNKFFYLNFNDIEAGYKFFKRSKIVKVLKDVKDKKWFFDTEITLRSKKSKLKISTIPVLFLRREDKKSTVRIIPDTIIYIKSLFSFYIKNR